MSAYSQTLPSALSHLDEIRVQAAGRDLAIFLDYDGTLTPIVERPELAVLSEETRAAVRRLAETMRVAVISGRDLKDVKRLVGIDNIFYAGSHGFEIEGPGGWRLDSRKVMDFLPCLDRAEEVLRAELSSIEGALIERKRFSIAIHYRLAAEDRLPDINRIVGLAEQTCPKQLRRTTGKKVYELQPNIDWNKGRAVIWLLDALGLKAGEVLPVFIGDDITDEDAFRALRGQGIGIIVRDEPRLTEARYGLDNTEEVNRFLGRIIPAE